MPTNKELIINWISALRSGKYQQGKYQLYIPFTNRYCCIGVFANCNNMPLSDNGISFQKDVEKGNVEIYSPLADIIGNVEVCELYGKNDDLGWSFDEIAYYIERNILPNITN